MSIERIDKYLTHATFGNAPAKETPQSIARPLGEAQIKDNLRRLKYPCFVTVHPDGTRSYLHDPGVSRDALISSASTDRGEGSRDSIKLLGEEDNHIQVHGLLNDTHRPPREDFGDPQQSGGPARDASGRFAAKTK